MDKTAALTMIPVYWEFVNYLLAKGNRCMFWLNATALCNFWSAVLVKKIFLIFILLHALFDHRSFAEGQKFAHCAAIWSDYVELGRHLLGCNEREAPTLLFVGTGGEIHNRLGERVELDTLRTVQGHETSLSVIFDGEIGDKPKDCPLNVCTVANARLEPLTYWKVNLPYEPSILRGATSSGAGPLDFLSNASRHFFYNFGCFEKY
ncbi:hypothetical protein [uncultured Roseobacter sp.]|uniref:hypothetical protein n=1 Tax=uncultured Roseobacter sp. TaxID=114847 RepID=UPI002605148C|nr:hypothetical protein [uncultured Roseobacter sp.]